MLPNISPEEKRYTIIESNDRSAEAIKIIDNKINIFAEHLKITENYHLSHSIAHFLNCFLGSAAKGGITAVQPPSTLRPLKITKKKKQTSPSSPFNLSHAALWESIISSVKEKFLYELPKKFGTF